MPKCYYELLEIERDADGDTIKKNYRKMALKWHPDKNPDNIEEATKTFALLQQAYDTLSDPQERAWYDRHREQILRGGFDEENYKDDSLDLLKYHCRCWDGFGDDKKGFFAVYREVFETLTEEDRDFHDDAKDGNYPQFGDSTTDPEEIVSKFYGFWTSFCTVRSFTWVEEYDIRQAPNRPTMRAMEKENEKMRQAAKAERNEQIRDLAAFIRKKDPRVVAYREMLEEKKKENQKKNEARMRQQRIDNLKNLGVHKESDEAKEEWRRRMEEIEDELDEAHGAVGSDLSDEGEDGEDVPYCIVCAKAFKSMKTKENHEKSKAHKQKLAELKKHLKEEERDLLLEGMGEAEEGEEQEQAENTPRGKKTKKARKKEKERRRAEEEDKDDEEKNEEDDLAEAAEGLTLEEKDEEGEKKEENIFLAAAKVPAKKEKKKGKEDATINVQEPVKGGETVPKTALCDKCGEFFESRSRLFAHLKETGHATPLVMAGSGGGGKKNKGKKGKKGADEW